MLGEVTLAGRVLGLVLVIFVLPAPSIAEEPFRTDWIVVKLKTPLDRLDDGSYSLATGRPALDAAIVQQEIHRIEHALPRSTLEPRDPEALARFGLDRFYKFHVPAGADVQEMIRRFSRLPEVELAEPDYIDQLTGVNVPDDPLFPQQWSYDQGSDADVDGPEAWDIETGDRLIVAVLDSGLDFANREEFAGRLVPGFDFPNNDAIPDDDFNHGHLVASIVAAGGNDSIGMAGTCWGCQVMPVKVIDFTGNGTITWFADGVVFATDNGASVINHSGSGSHSNLRLSSVKYAYAAGVIWANSAGNGVAIPFPNRYRETIAVGASNILDEKASFSSFGQYLDLLAPGEDVVAQTVGGAYGFADGTSFSAPLVAGLAGLIKSIHSSVGQEEARQLIVAGAEDLVGPAGIDLPGWDEDFGFGRANMELTLLGTQAVTTLRVDGGANTRLFYETANPLADSYDFIRGDLSAIGPSGTGIELGSVVCIENDSVDPDTAGNEDAAIPAQGQAFYYLGRFNKDVWPGSYGGSSGNRDRMTPDPATAAEWMTSVPEWRSRYAMDTAWAGDVNNDGFDDVIVGAQNFPGAGGEGKAFVYHGSSGGLSTTPAWSIEGSQAGSGLGRSVATAGDVNNDGFDDVIVSEHLYDGGLGPQEGRALVYLGSETGVQNTVHRILRDPQAGAQFGYSVQTAGDVNDDGFADVIVAARRYSGGQNVEGKAYVYHGSSTGLVGTPVWTFEPDIAIAALRAVGAAGDLNGDGFDDVACGAHLLDGADMNEGRVWVFYGSSLGLSDTPTVLSIGGVDSQFGYDVETAGDVNNDGFDDLVVAAVSYADGQVAEGAAFLFLGSDTGVSTTPDWTFETDQTYAYVRFAGTAGDVNNDGFDDVVVGAERYRQTRLNEGAAWLFLGSETGLADTPFWMELGWQIDARFGWRGGRAGDVDGDGLGDLIIGANAYDNGGFDEGAAYVFHGSATAIGTTQPADCDLP
jgi:hypothetical protein